jgi:hypothetical protein
MNEINEEAYNRYFRNAPEVESTASVRDFSKNIYESTMAARAHVLEQLGSHKETSGFRNLADDNIDDIEQLANILKRLCNAAWGEGWGELSPDLKTGEDSSNIILPQITVDLNSREVAEGMGGLKPRLVDIIAEEDGEGEPTGDAFLIYRQWYDCNVEFNIYGRNSKEARELQKKFEALLLVYSGYLKRHGVSEIIFEQETSGKCSLNYVETHPMRSIYYYIRLESITPVRQSLINKINAEIGAGQITTEKVRTALMNSASVQNVELDFFEGDTGVTYNI